MSTAASQVSSISPSRKCQVVGVDDKCQKAPVVVRGLKHLGALRGSVGGPGEDVLGRTCTPSYLCQTNEPFWLLLSGRTLIE